MVWIEYWIWIIVCPLIAYFIGSIPFSYIIAKWRSGEDIRKLGTKNVGGLNVMINVGYNWGIFAGFLDFFKGIACLVSAMVIPFNNTPLGGSGDWTITQHQLIYIFVAMAVILGHNYPIYLNFQGGRGIAAIVAFLLITNPIILLIFIISMAIFMFITKTVRPSQFLAIFVGVPVAFFLNFYPPWIVLNNLDGRLSLGLFILGISLAIFPKYIVSFINLFKGKEYSLGRAGVVIPEEKEEKQDVSD
ncbi:MAG: glycerol-3-phosphate acyltransferase [Asgard group archaeon]|nr:glycerol-3-phosphate acyltransferase [Asgard group archaeon]